MLSTKAAQTVRKRMDQIFGKPHSHKGAHYGNACAHPGHS
jgi:hypothetical protein